MKKIILCSISGLLVSFICFASNADQVCPTIVWPTGHSDQNNGSWYAEGLRYGNCYYTTCYNNGNAENSDFRQSIMDEYSNLWQQFGGTDNSTNFPKDQFISGIRNVAGALQQVFNNGYTKYPSGVSFPVPDKPFPMGFGMYARGYRDGIIYMMIEESDATDIRGDCGQFYHDLYDQGIPVWSNWTRDWMTDDHFCSHPLYRWYRLKLSSDQRDEYRKGIHDACPDLENKIVEADKDMRGGQHHVAESSFCVDEPGPNDYYYNDYYMGTDLYPLSDDPSWDEYKPY